MPSRLEIGVELLRKGGATSLRVVCFELLP